ncbi:MAG: hypothetical protein JSW34_10760 [Candidatus Zixiibacteriota bacterium]|nr:MAG: hypothetical protein JSW34_10760 [candidate division Zixibacteria bacterium]
MVRKITTPLICGLLTFIIVFAIVIGCSEDLVLDPLPSLLGEYEGRYYITTNYGASNARTEEFLIALRFSDLNYWMRNYEDTVTDLCEPSGDYVLADGVEFVEKEANCYGSIASEDDNPTGVFTLYQPGDSLIMVQIEGDICKEIKVTPAQEE